MNIYMRVLWASVSLVLYAPLSAVCSYRLIQAPNGKLILIIGDKHVAAVKPYADIIIHVLKNASLIKPLTCVVELQEIEQQRKDDVIVSEPIKALRALHRSYKTDGESPLSLTFCEPRGWWSDMLDIIREFVVRCGLALTSREERDARYGKFGVRLPENLVDVNISWDQKEG